MPDINKTSTLIEHLAELRKRLIIIFVVNLVGALLCYQYIDVLIQFLLDLNPGMELIYISPSELFMVYIQLALICAIIICSPVTVMQIWGFVAQGLFRRERFYGIIALVAGAGFFIVGAVFCYFTALPITLAFFLRITIENITPMISIQSYVSFCTRLLACFGLAFEMPVVVFLLSELEILKPAALKRTRGVLILLIFVAAALLTPPDVLTQIILAIPMVLLLQFSYGICWFIAKQKDKKHRKLEKEAAV
ncbi:MAG: twin-arginine translocase subunit TatC [Lachnospiraceae bacterium]|nr:twin-arginine translocase subunit TatC [Lachnospiraceae bacterium]